MTKVIVELTDGRSITFDGEFKASEMIAALHAAGVTRDNLKNTIHVIPKGTLTK